jgi:hypothetical protein
MFRALPSIGRLCASGADAAHAAALWRAPIQAWSGSEPAICTATVVHLILANAHARRRGWFIRFLPSDLQCFTDQTEHNYFSWTDATAPCIVASARMTVYIHLPQFGHPYAL